MKSVFLLAPEHAEKLRTFSNFYYYYSNGDNFPYISK